MISAIQFATLEVSGPDAKDFLQRLTTVQVKNLLPTHGIHGALLTGQSHLLSQFDLLFVAKDIYWLVTPKECFSTLIEELERMHFSENLRFKKREEIFSVVFGNEEAARETFFPLTIGSLGELEAWPSSVPGFLMSLAEEWCISNELPRKKIAPAQDFHFARIGALVPWPLQDWSKGTPALEAGVLPWIHRNKGCYPGQEVVEKSLNVGHPARVLEAWEGNIPLGDIVILPGGLQGVVTSVAAIGDQTRALVRVPWSARGKPVSGFTLLQTHFPRNEK